MGKLLEELKRRKVFRIAGVYAVVGWVLAQVAAFAVETFAAPQWVQQIFVVFLILGFPLALILAWAYEVTPGGVKADDGTPSSQTVGNSTDRKLIYVVLGLVTLLGGLQVSDRFVMTADQSIDLFDRSALVTRVSVFIPENQFFNSSGGDFDVSDDGAVFVYRGTNAAEQPVLWIRRWDELNATELRDTLYPGRPKISPDGQEVVFWARGQIRVVPLYGGVSRTLVDSVAVAPNWSPDGSWVYFSNSASGISRVPSAGGAEEVITDVDISSGGVEHSFVEVLSAERILYTVRNTDGTFKIQSANLEAGKVKDLTPGTYPIYSTTGHLFFQSVEDATLLVAPFDVDTLEITGPAIALAEGLLQEGRGRAGSVGISRTGRLVFRIGDSAGRLGTPVWVDRDGVSREIDSGWQVSTIAGGAGSSASSLTLSPDGGRLAISLFDTSQNTRDLWIKRLDTGPLSRITSTGLGFTSNSHPAWSPDGRSLTFGSGLASLQNSVWSISLDAVGTGNSLLEWPAVVWEAFYSSDERWLVFRDQSDTFNIYAIQVTTDTEAVPLVVDQFNAVSPALSPDDRWLAYVSDATGRNEVYVRPFLGQRTVQVSANGGIEPVWAHSGRELFYRNGDQEMIAVQLSDGTDFDWTAQDVLFSTAEYSQGIRHAGYDIDQGDDRFVMVKLLAPDHTELILVDNWMEDLK